MSMKPSELRYGLGNEADLTTPTTTQQYPLGAIVELEDSATKTVKRYIYVYASVQCTIYLPYAIAWTSVSGQEVIGKAVSTMATPGSLVGVPPATIAATYYGFIQIYGDATAYGSFTSTYGLQVKNNSAAAFQNGSSTTLVTVDTIAIAKATASTTTVAIFLLGRPATISAT